MALNVTIVTTVASRAPRKKDDELRAPMASQAGADTAPTATSASRVCRPAIDIRNGASSNDHVRVGHRRRGQCNGKGSTAHGPHRPMTPDITIAPRAEGKGADHRIIRRGPCRSIAGIIVRSAPSCSTRC